MTDYVLVHGAWHGAWCWKRVRDLLTAHGHRAFTPTLTGLGERSHLLSPSINLGTHVADVTNVLLFQELQDIVLVGHSYGGIIVRHVADRMPERVRSLIYLDAFVPEDGKALTHYLADSGQSMRQRAADQGENWKIAPLPASFFSVNEADAAWVDRQCTAHPLVTFEEPASLNGRCDTVGSIGYIWASHHKGPHKQFYDKAKERGWWTREFACGHDVMLDMPRELTALLLEAARGGQTL
jgi:pimeloyl-ACP methyl ester carboxylesterase